MDELAALLNQRWQALVRSHPEELNSIGLIYTNGIILEENENEIKEVQADEPLYFLLCKIFPDLKIHYARIEVYLLSPFGGDDMYYEIEVYDSENKSLRNIGLH
jgi:hypothetical protein